MARYETLGNLFSNQRLGSFESFGQDTAAESGTSSVLIGVGSILAPLAQAGVGIFAATQQAKLEKARLKAERAGGGGVDQATLAALLASTQRQETPKSKAPVIIAILGSMAVVAVILIVALKKK